MKDISKTLNVVSVLIFIIAFVTKGYSINRLILIMLGIVISTIGLIYSKKRSLIAVLLFSLTWLIGLYFIDAGSVYFFNLKPIFATKVKSSKDFITYNSVLYRQFECKNKTYMDILYNKSDYCSFDSLEEKDINSLSSDIVNNFKKYKNKFYIINAKVSYKEGNTKIDLKSYSDEESINGNVTFNDNIIYKCEFANNENIDNIKVYDSVRIVARITKKKKDKDVYTIILKDVHFLKQKDYSNFTINVVENKNCSKDKTNYVKTKDNNYYTSCLSKVYAIYDKDVYDLSYVLKDEKINLDDLLKEYDEMEEKELDEDKKDFLYKFDKYNILVCSNDSVIIGNKNLDIDSNYCEVKDVDTNDL